MATTHTVVSGDTLWDIVLRYGLVKNGETTLQAADRIATLNNIPNRDLITPGQVLKLEGEPDAVDVNTSYNIKIRTFAIQANTTNTLFAIWDWDKKYTEKYAYEWTYVLNGIKMYGDVGTKTVDENSPDASKYSTYQIPNGASSVSFKVKAISKKRTVNNAETSYWTCNWSTTKTYNVSDLPPAPPSSPPNVKIEQLQLTATYTNLNVEDLYNPTHIRFAIWQDNTRCVHTHDVAITNGYASYVYTVEPGHVYTVRCRSVKGELTSEDWTNFSNEAATIPAVPEGFTMCKANRSTTDGSLSIFLKWDAVNTADSYDIQYATQESYFDGTDQTTDITGIEELQREIFSLTPGYEYFFRLRAKNSAGESDWSPISSVVLGKKPAAPTTWSSTSTAIVDESLNLYWVHNSEDGSNQTAYNIQIYADGVLFTDDDVKTVYNVDDDNTAYSYPIVTTSSTWREGAVLEWRVRTAGITGDYGEWSVLRRVDIYAKPSLKLVLTDSNGTSYENIQTDVTISSFPFYISALASPKTQTPLGYQLAVMSNSMYETVDNIGNTKMVNVGDMIFNRYFDIDTLTDFEFSAHNLTLENGASYTIACSVTMNSGLVADASVRFEVSWEWKPYTPNAEISIDTSNYSAYIRPHVENEFGIPIEGVFLSVYRREFDGTFTEIAKNVENDYSTFVVDPHPSLDYARYRVVATAESTGIVGYYDVPNYPVGGKAAIIQWNEQWNEFQATTEDVIADPVWSGVLLKLPYNIDVSDKYGMDVSLVEYIGRKHPVSYYGTQLGEAQTWNISVPKTDVETLYMLRRLAIWTGNVYVREPSGTGYWANVNVSFSKKHLEVTIPVTIEVTRVEGGV